MKIKLQIVEDDIHVIEIIKQYLAKFTFIEIIGVTSTIETTYNTYFAHKPDILLLDIQLGEENIFNWINLIQPSANIIFITAHPAYAINAIKIGAKDYVLKPINEFELNIAINKAITSVTTKTNELVKVSQQKIAIAHLNCIDYVAIADIVYLKAIGNYTTIYLTNATTITSSKPLKYFENSLPHQLFVRIHHSYIIQLLH